MARPINKEKVLENKTEVKQYTLFNEIKSKDLDWFLDVYKQDPYKARVLYMNGKNGHNIERQVCFERTDGSFEICRFVKKIGISKTNRVYSSEKKIYSLIYKDKKFYFKQGSVLKHANFEHISSYFSFAYDFLEGKFAWLRNIKEDRTCHQISLSTIVKNKLYNADKILKHIYKVPTPIIKILKQVGKNPTYSRNFSYKTEWQRALPYLINVENLSLELIKNHLFSDTVDMAIKLDRRVNCSWSAKRLKIEHDNWSKDLSKIMREFEPIVQLNPHKVYEDFEHFSGYKLLRTNHDLLNEGDKQRHCVAGYANQVKSGYSGIFIVDKYTLELQYREPWYDSNSIKKTKQLCYAQLRGFANCSAPKELDDKVKELIRAFNEKYDFKQCDEDMRNRPKDIVQLMDDHERELLPF